MRRSILPKARGSDGALNASCPTILQKSPDEENPYIFVGLLPARGRGGGRYQRDYGPARCGFFFWWLYSRGWGGRGAVLKRFRDGSVRNIRLTLLPPGLIELRSAKNVWG